MRLGSYLKHSLPTGPASVDYMAKGGTPLKDVYGNDALGDCVIAGYYHLLALLTGNATGVPFHALLAQIVAAYRAIGGYVPGDPSTDQGCDEQTALNWFMAHAAADGSKALGWLKVDARNKAEVQAALWLFENLFFGIELPDAWLNPFPEADGYVWDVGAPDPNNGHCIIGGGYDATGVKVDSWGLFGTVTYDAIAALCSGGTGELYVVLNPDQVAKGQAKAPNGVDWTSLIADFDSFGGHVPIPAPPAPPPAPVPPATPVTLAQAQAWAKGGLDVAPRVMTRAIAEAAVAKALAAHWPPAK
jgi:hypothetical protein